jgi:serine/threonine-protein kinase SRPK3
MFHTSLAAIYFDHNNSFDVQLYELLSGEPLFDPFFQTEELGLSIEESHIIQIIEIFGDFPRELLAAGEYSSRWFTESGTLIRIP